MTTERRCKRNHEPNWHKPPNGWPYCRTCKNESQAVRRKPRCTHDGPHLVARDANGNRYCRVQRAQGLRAALASRDAKAAAVPVDGWEAEYGPCPPKVPEHLWVDRVALERHLRGFPVGRPLTAGERRALVFLSALRSELPDVIQAA
ncbi:hypothetical protein [Amycolatopsis orientalis]|uniref:hypothetical protein n=1 Tax=Amycolatopsis orientalis TaxID=31958 RepID=UPI00055DAEDA|nr:hypothetical protein [Amycolatopsis orientalis]